MRGRSCFSFDASVLGRAAGARPGVIVVFLLVCAVGVFAWRIGRAPINRTMEGRAALQSSSEGLVRAVLPSRPLSGPRVKSRIMLALLARGEDQALWHVS